MDTIINSEYIHISTHDCKNIRNKLACFDLDGTIIKTKSGNRFPKNFEDWEFLYKDMTRDTTRDKILNFHKRNYAIIIITNQGGLNSQTKIDEWVKKIKNIISCIGVGIDVYCSIGNNKYRKPIVGFFDMIKKNVPSIDYTKSFYCGDACGRKYDHSDCDLKFAINCNLTFYTPEQLFLNDKVVYKIPDKKILEYDEVSYDFSKLSGKVIAVFVGYPACGKSYTAGKTVDFKIINQDKLITKAKCLKEVEKLMKSNAKIIIDNTNPDTQTRAGYINIAKKHNYVCVCVYFDISREIATHNAGHRTYVKGICIPNIVYNIFDKKFEMPTISEGFSNIIVVKPKINNSDLYYA